MKPWRAYTNVLKMRLNMALRRTVLRTYPVMAMVEPTVACNLRCPACPTGLQLNLRPASTLGWDLYKSLLDDIGEYVFHLSMYNWGEPLLHKQTPDFIRYAKEKEIRITLSSNLSLNLTDEYVERLVLSGLDELLVGLDGASPESYGIYRRRGDFRLVRSNMMRIQETKARLGASTPHVTWQFLVFRHNEHEIEYARTHFREYGADSILVGGAEMPSEPDARGLAPSTIPRYNRYHPDHPVQAKERWILAGRDPCSWLYGVLVMNPNGKLSPCCATADERDDFGQYSAEGGIFDAWNSDRYRRARGLFGRAARKARGGAGDAGAATDVGAVSDLICQRCPIVHLQDRVHVMIARTAYDCLRRGLDPRYLLALVLMGGPTFHGVKLLIRKLLRREEIAGR